MKYYAVVVEDHQTKERVCVVDMCTRVEAIEVVNYISKFCACIVYFIESGVM